MRPARQSGGQILIRESDHLTTAPSRTKLPTPRVEEETTHDDDHRGQ